MTPYTHPPVSTVHKTAICRDLWQSNGNLPYSALFRQVPLNSAIFCQVPPNSAKFYQDHVPRVNQATKSTICTLSSRFPTFLPYATSWPYYTVHVHSLIISTLLYIIVAYIHSVTANSFLFTFTFLITRVPFLIHILLAILI